MSSKSTMSKLALVLFYSSWMVFVESQGQSCSTKNDCRDNGCCYNSVCYYSSSYCALYESLCKTRPKGLTGCSCYKNSDCTSGCCSSSTCTSYEKCRFKSCYYNYQCSSGCCKDYRCERSSTACSYNYRTTRSYPTTAVPTQTTPDEYGSKSCYYNYQCDSGYCTNYRCERTYGTTKTSFNSKFCYYNYQCSSNCCKHNRCQRTSACYDYETTAYPFQYTTTFYSKFCYGNWGCDSGCCKGDRCQQTAEACYDKYTTSQPTYYATDFYDYHDYDDYPHSSSSSMSVGARVGLAVAILFVAIVKIVFWVTWCSRRRRGVVVSRTACARSGVSVAIVQHDHLQREHEWLATTHDIIQGPPPAYSPLPTSDAREDATRNVGQNPTQTNLGPREGTSGGVPQGLRTEPPPMYSLSIAPNVWEDTTQNAGQNPTQSDLTPRQQLVNTSRTYGVPQGTPTGLTQTDLTQRASTEETHDVPQGTPSTPLLPNLSQ